MTQTGWRKPTPGLGRAEQFAQAGEQISVAKSEAFVAVKRVGAHIGLKAGDLMLLDTLGAFTQPQDWDAHQRPIVWASNAFLMAQTGFSLSALKRHARRLAEAGVIAFRDSPNGKRWGRRDQEGRIVEAYGFDLSPLAARAEEFAALHREIQAERALCQRLKRQITIARRSIRARLEAATEQALRGAWGQFLARFEDLLSGLPRGIAGSERLAQVLRRFSELQDRVEEAFRRAADVLETQEMDPKEANIGPHIRTTTELDPVTCNSSETEKAADVVHLPDPVAPVESEETEKGAPRRGVALDVPTVMQACPEFATWARDLGGYLRDWGDVYRMAGQLRPMIGISDHAWLAAQEGLGKQAAAAAMVLVFDKHATGEVASPGGYLRGMVEKAGAGDLHLERSIYGRLAAQAA